MRQCGTQFCGHLVPLLSWFANTEMMPRTKADSVGMLRRLDANPAPILGDMLDGGPAVQVPSKQAGQTATIDLDLL